MFVTLSFTQSIFAENLNSFLIDSGNFKTFQKAVAIVGLENTIKNLENKTVFLPTDASFANLEEGQLTHLLEDKEKLKEILLNHIIEGARSESILISKSGEYSALSGLPVLANGYSYYGKTFATMVADCDRDGMISSRERREGQDISKANIRLDNNVIVHVLDLTTDRVIPGSNLFLGTYPQILGLNCAN